MPKKVVTKEETPVAVTQEVRGELTVTWNGNSRVYSKELHGADFKKLAEEFAVKVGGEVV